MDARPGAGSGIPAGRVITWKSGVPDDSQDAQLSIKGQIAGALRGLFLAPEGQVFVAGDLSQIKSRVLCCTAAYLRQVRVAVA